MHEEIAADYVKAPVNFGAGGGYKYFLNRSDGQNLFSELNAKGVIVDTTALQSTHDPSQDYLYLLGVDSLHSKKGGRDDFLPRVTNLAIDYLDAHKEGFFIMIESSQIDWGGHDNDASFIIQETRDFDEVVGAALDFAEQDGNTLVIVTADHETGGMSLSSFQQFGKRDYTQIRPTFSTGGHSASLVPVFAYGPGSEHFTGIYQNTEIFHKMKGLLKVR